MHNPDGCCPKRLCVVVLICLLVVSALGLVGSTQVVVNICPTIYSCRVVLESATTYQIWVELGHRSIEICRLSCVDWCPINGSECVFDESQWRLCVRESPIPLRNCRELYYYWAVPIFALLIPIAIIYLGSLILCLRPPEESPRWRTDRSYTPIS